MVDNHPKPMSFRTRLYWDDNQSLVGQVAKLPDLRQQAMASSLEHFLVKTPVYIGVSKTKTPTI
jgi:hypothetical protein